jgi:hypothetical protein
MKRPVDLASVPNASGGDGSDIGAVEVQASTQTPFGGSPMASATISGTTPQWYEWDITSLVQHEKDLGHGTITLILQNPNQSKSFVQFHSDDAGSDRPQILVLG